MGKAREELIEITTPSRLMVATHVVFNGQKISTEGCARIVVEMDAGELPKLTMEFVSGGTAQYIGSGDNKA